VVAGLANRRGGVAAGARDRMDVGDDLRRRAFDTLPAREDVFKEFQIFRRVDRGDRRKAEIARPDDLATGGAGSGKQPLDALGLFRIGLGRTAGQKGFRVVALLFVGKEGFHDHSRN
jgi:hypothetical protein